MAYMQEDEDDAARKQDAAEDMFIDVLSPHDDFPVRPNPANGFDPVVLADEGEAGRHARLVRAVAEWADDKPDDDTWQAFYLSVDLIEEIPEDEAN
jgi:COMPASS component SWD1